MLLEFCMFDGVREHAFLAFLEMHSGKARRCAVARRLPALGVAEKEERS